MPSAGTHAKAPIYDEPLTYSKDMSGFLGRRPTPPSIAKPAVPPVPRLTDAKKAVDSAGKDSTNDDCLGGVFRKIFCLDKRTEKPIVAAPPSPVSASKLNVEKPVPPPKPTPEDIRAAGGVNSPDLYASVTDPFRKNSICDAKAVTADMEAYSVAPTAAALADVEDLTSGTKGITLQTRGRDGFMTIRMDMIKQRMQGFGFSHAYYKNRLADHPNKKEIDDIIFRDLQPSIIRLRNVYRHGGNEKQEMENDARFMRDARRILGNEAPKVMLCAWSPPKDLKENGQLNGVVTDTVHSSRIEGTVLKKDSRGWFMYGEFADWFADAHNAYKSLGVTPTWLSVQNEPDFQTPGHESCLYGAVESFEVPSIYIAGRNLRDAVDRKVDKDVQIIGPESFGLDLYLNEFPFGGGGVFSAIANHLYASSDHPDYTDPWAAVPEMERTRDMAARKNMQDVFMTEFAFLRKHQYQDPLRMAIVIHNSLTIANVTAYVHWDGFWGSNVTNDEGTLLHLDQADRSTWSNEKGYTILHSFYWMMHFSKFIRPGHLRVRIENGVIDVLTSAFTGPNGVFAVIHINTSSSYKNVTMIDLPEWIQRQRNEVFYSTLDEVFTSAGGFIGDNIWLKPRSITTITSRQ